MAVYRAKKAYRQTAAILGRGKKPVENPFCAVLPLVTTQGRLDLDNALGSLKAALDGLTDAKWWSDDSAIEEIKVVKPTRCPHFREKSILILCDSDSFDLEVRISTIRQQVELHPEQADEVVDLLINGLPKEGR
jgi:hypothetical protein